MGSNLDTIMKAGWAFLLTGIIIIAIGIAWIIAGWPAGEPFLPVIDHEPELPALPRETTGVPPFTIPAESLTPASTPIITSDAIKLHFLDIAFGGENARLWRWDATYNNGRIIVAVNGNSDTDILQLETAAREFNSVSQTNKVSERIKQGSGEGDITIKFVPESGMDGIAINTSESMPTKELTVNDIIAAKITRGTIYINANLKGDVRNHTLIHSFFYELGAVGDTDTYPDSVFYRGNNTNANLTYADKGAIGILYGSGLAQGMTMSDVREIVYIR